jgi:hypothetical protein
MLFENLYKRGGDVAFKSILDKGFYYRNSASTDIRLTFDRIRRERQLAEPRADQSALKARVVAAIGRTARPA